MTAPAQDPVASLYATLLRAYPSYEHAALDGARWIMGPGERLLLRRSYARVTGDPRADDDPPPEDWKPGPGDRLLALPVEVRAGAGPARLVPGPNARRQS